MAVNEFGWNNGSGIQIFAREWKPDSGEVRGAVALVHGLGEHSDRYQHVAAAFNAAGYALLSFDLPGHGRSGGQRGHFAFEDVLKDIDCLLQETAERYPELPRFLYGHSLGGNLALFYTLRRKPTLNGVIATSPGLRVGAPVPPAKLALAKLMARIAPAFSLSNGLDRANLSRDPEVVRVYGSDPLVHDRISARLGLDLITQGEWVLANAASLSLPLLLVQGSGDTTVSPQASQEFARSAPPEQITYKVWEGYYHETHNEPEKQQVIQYIIDWLDAHN